MPRRRLAGTAPPVVSYSPQFLAIMALRLHRNAILTVAAYAVCGCVLGAATFPLATRYLVQGASAASAVCGAIIMGVMGVLVGREAAVFLRIQAQVALCELSVAERSTQEETEPDADKRRRRSPRIRVPLTAHAKVGEKQFEATINSINRHGFFLQTKEVPEPGRLIELDVSLPNLPPVSMTVIPRFIGRTAAGAGMGVEIFDMPTEDEAAWRSFYERLKAKRPVSIA